MSRTEDADDELMAELSQVLRAAAEMPDGARDAARALFTWRTVDAELAALSYDSLLDGAAPVTRAGAGQPRVLTFAADAVTIEVEVDENRAGRRLVGQVEPAGPARLELRTTAGTVEGRADELGRFVLALPPAPERISLVCRLADGSVIESASVVV